LVKVFPDLAGDPSEHAQNDIKRSFLLKKVKRPKGIYSAALVTQKPADNAY
jgi:hypothetical protein